MKSRWRTWNGIDVVHLDYAGFRGDLEALRAEVEEADRMMLAQRPNSLLVLIDLRETIASPAAVQLFRASAPVTAPFIRRHALLGITGIKRFLADKVARLAGRPMRLFSTEEDALDWLVSGESPVSASVSADDVVGIHPGTRAG